MSDKLEKIQQLMPLGKMQEIPEVEVTVSGEDADAQAARELEEKIEARQLMIIVKLFQ